MASSPTISTQATNSSIQQSSNHNNTNSLVNSQNTYNNLILNMPHSMKRLKIDMAEGGGYEMRSTSAQSSPSTPRASSSTYPQTSQDGQQPAPDQVQSEPDLREKGYLASMRSGFYPKSKVKVKNLTHEAPLPLPKYTPDNITAYMRTLPQKEVDVIPLWSASPNEETSRNVTIGDVGIFNPQGGFETKFNIFSKGNRGDGLEPPPDFVPCRQARERMGNIRVDWHNVCGLIPKVESGKWSCIPESNSTLVHSLPKRAEGYCSALYLPYGGRRFWIDTSSLPNVMQYAAAHAPSWYCYQNTAEDGKRLLEKYDELQNKCLIVVTEVWKTSAWFSVQTTEQTDFKALSALHQQRQIKATVQKSPDPTTRTCSCTCETGFTMNTGPEASMLKGQENQCVAIKGFQLIYDPKLPLWSPSGDQKSGGDGSSILSRLSFWSRKTGKTRR